jgi:hypothetical protein
MGSVICSGEQSSRRPGGPSRPTRSAYSGEDPEKLAHLADRPMNEFHELGPNTVHFNQKPQNPFTPGNRVQKAGDLEASVAVVEVLPPEKEGRVYGQTMDGEAVSVAFPSSLDEEPVDWRTIYPAKLVSYCDDQDIGLYTYKHTNLEFADNPFAPGDYVIKTEYDDPDLAVVVAVDENEAGRDISVVFLNQFDSEDDQQYIPPADLVKRCETDGVKQYTYHHSALELEPPA